MPKIIVSYLYGLVTGYKVTATSLARQFGFSHDGITRMLVSRFPWKKWYIWCIHRLFGILEGEYLIIDDVVLAKPFGKLFAHASVELAMLLLEEIRFKWKIKNCTVLYDSWYAAAKVIRLIKRLGYHFVSQIKRNRKVNNIPLSALQIRDNILLDGIVAGDIRLYYFKHEDKYYCTDISASNTQAIHTMYQIRWKIEEIFRFLKTALKLERCQVIRITAQKTHLVSCILSYLIFQKEQQENVTYQSLYQIHELWMFNKHIARCRINHYVKVLGLNAYC